MAIASAPRSRTGLRWAIYCRISGRQGVRIGDDDDTVSLETQESDCRDHIARLDPTGTVIESLVFRETHTGVELFTRPKLTQLREAVRRGEIDAIACYQPKRWTRDPDHAGYLRSELREYRVAVRFAVDDPGDGEAGALVGYVHHWSGKQEHRDITERTHRARVKLVELGHAWSGCKAPYGLRWRFETVQRRDGRITQKRIGWEIEPTEAAVVAGLFGALLAGQPLRGIARDLTERGIRSPKGLGGWSHIVVKQVLRNCLYTGEAYGLRHRMDRENEYVGVRGKSAGRLKYRPTVRSEEEWVKLPDGYAPRLVEPETFEAAQQMLDAKRPGGRRPADPTVTLMGDRRARCGHCGRAMSVRRRPNRSPSLLCTSRDGWQGCKSRPSILCSELDDAVRRLARLIYNHPDVIAEQAELHRENDPTEADLAMVEHTLTEIARKQEALAVVASRIVDPDAAAPLVTQLETLAAQKRTAQHDRGELLDRRAGWEASRQFLDGFAVLATNVGARLDRLDHDGWQQAIDALGIEARVWRADEPDRFTLTTRMDGILTAELLRSLVTRYGSILGPDQRIEGCMMEPTRT